MRLRASLLAHPQRRFLAAILGLYLLWWLGYEQLLGPDGRLDHLLSVQVAHAAAWALQRLGFAAATALDSPTTVQMLGKPAVLVGDPCNGLVLYALFAGFVLAYPGKTKRRCWFIPLGIGAIYLLNVVRVALLALNHTYWYHTVDFNHHYTFTLAAYAAILALGRRWVHAGAEVRSSAATW